MYKRQVYGIDGYDQFKEPKYKPAAVPAFQNDKDICQVIREGCLLYTAILFICKNKNLIQSLLDGSNAARILAFDHVHNLLRQLQLFLCNDLFVLDDIYGNIMIDKTKDIQIQILDGAFNLDDILFSHFLAAGIFDDSNRTVQLIQLQEMCIRDRYICIRFIYNRIILDILRADQTVTPILDVYKRQPKIGARGAEGGANLFKLSYFHKPAVLAQSPQFYKQMMVGVFDRVFETGPVSVSYTHLDESLQSGYLPGRCGYTEPGAA